MSNAQPAPHHQKTKKVGLPALYFYIDNMLVIVAFKTTDYIQRALSKEKGPKCFSVLIVLSQATYLQVLLVFFLFLELSLLRLRQIPTWIILHLTLF